VKVATFFVEKKKRGDGVLSQEKKMGQAKYLETRKKGFSKTGNFPGEGKSGK